MASPTLAQSALLSENELLAGVIEEVVTTDQFFQMLPMMPIEGNSLAYNRENVIGDTQVAGVGGSITATAAATFTQVTEGLTTIIGQAEINQLIQSTRSNINNQRAIQIASKAKSAGRRYRDMLINGTGASDQFTGLLSLCTSTQKVAAETNGQSLSFDILDELLDLVKDKDGQVDYIMMHERTLRSYKKLLRGLGGTAPDDVYTMANGTQIIAYCGVPIFKNNNIPIDQTQGTNTKATTIFAGTLDDGSGKYGISGLTAANDAGLEIEHVGLHQSRDEDLWRVKWYCSLALFSTLGLACAPGITN